MAHEIMNEDAMFYVGETPWHKLGTALDIPPSTEEALQLAKLDWTVFKDETVLPQSVSEGFNPFGYKEKPVLIPTGYYCTYRLEDGKPVFLGNVSERYEVLQNLEAFKPFDEVLLDAGYNYETAGALGNGERIWILAKAPDSLMINGDRVDKYVFLMNSHDGSTAVILQPTPIRVVCNNTLTWALEGSKSRIAMKHTQGVRNRLKQVINMLKTAEGNINQAAESWNRMVDIKMDMWDAIKYFEQVSPKLKNRGIVNHNTPTGRKAPDFQQKIFDKLKFNFVNGKGNSGQNLWHAYNSITEYVDHDRNHSDWITGTQFGSGANLKTNAFRIANNWVQENSTPSISLNAL